MPCIVSLNHRERWLWIGTYFGTHWSERNRNFPLRNGNRLPFHRKCALLSQPNLYQKNEQWQVYIATQNTHLLSSLQKRRRYRSGVLLRSENTVRNHIEATFGRRQFCLSVTDSFSLDGVLGVADQALPLLLDGIVSLAPELSE